MEEMEGEGGRKGGKEGGERGGDQNCEKGLKIINVLRSL